MDQPYPDSYIEEPPHTCPMIDEALKTIDRAIGYAKDCRAALKYSEGDDAREADDKADDAITEMGWIDLETIRQNCEALRTWGSEWKDEAENTRREADALEARVRKLEARVAWLEGILERRKS